jgi:hypothetical protein
MKNLMPLWFFKVFVMPYCYVMMTLGEAISYRDRGYGMSEYEEEQFYNRYFHICFFLGIMSCAFTIYIVVNFTKYFL